MTGREQHTIRFPEGLLDALRKEAEIAGTSLNDIVVEAAEQEVKRRSALRLLERISQRRREIEKRGIQPDSTPLIRALREGEERR